METTKNDTNQQELEFNGELKTLINQLDKILINTKQNRRIILYKEIIKTYYNKYKIKEFDKDLLDNYLIDVNKETQTKEQPKGTVSDTKTNNNKDEEEHKKQMREWREKNQDKIKEWKENNKDKLKEYQKKYFNNNKEKFKQYQKNYYENHPEKLEQAKEKKRIISREYYNKNKTVVLSKMRDKYNLMKTLLKEKQEQETIKEEPKETPKSQLI